MNICLMNKTPLRQNAYCVCVKIKQSFTDASPKIS